MGDFTEAKPLDIGPIYFFDQMKPKRKRWEKTKHEDCIPHLKYRLRHEYSHTENTKSKELEALSTITIPEENYESHSSGISPFYSVSKFSPHLKSAKICLQKRLLEEYKLTASEILNELAEILQKYVEYNITFPVGIVNLINYSWSELTEGAYKCETKAPRLKKHSILQKESTSMPIADLKEYQVPSSSMEEYHKENKLVQTKHVSVLVKQIPNSQTSQNSSIPAVIRFSLRSKICLENGWIFQHPYSPSEILKWKTVFDVAVKRLQVAIIQIKKEEAKLKKKGFNKPLILHHYNDFEDTMKVGSNSPATPCFWLELLKRKPQLPTIKEVDPAEKKFHYSLVDGSSLTYYPSGRLAVCQSYSALPWGGMYTNIFSDFEKPVILGTFTPFGCGSISFPKSQISMMFNRDGGIVFSKKGDVVKEWMWPSKGKLNDPVEIWVNKFITVKISGLLAITLVYKWHLQSLKLSLAPVKCKSFPPRLPEPLFPDVNSITKEVKELCDNYKIKYKQVKSTIQDKDPLTLTDPEATGSFDTVVDISPMHDIASLIKLRKLQRKVKHILLHWLDHYRFAMGIELMHICKMPKFLQKVVRKQKVKQSAKEKDEAKEYQRYRSTFLKLKGASKPSPRHRKQKSSAGKSSFRCLLPIESKDTSHLVCPVVLRRALCGKEGDTCRCSAYSIPEVTDLEYDYLISNLLSSVDQIIIVCVFSVKDKGKNVKEVTKVYRELNRARSMPCTQMYIRGKLLFANFIFNGYSTSAKDLQKQIVKTRNDYHMGYFLPKDFRIRAQPTACFGSENTFL
ncbi:uncharacterized protein C3orf20-like isoform X2 [Talpa occidentalis]|uniref:uncharacterized protein C3orf20-like isoform X2 n=1 Tax=Talpa occidentalis TaxID=50954 RepID=UPI0018900EF6|nr:uncharacterized protein C3orf20-like isoform X2 [Talpa occidentalis]